MPAKKACKLDVRAVVTHFGGQAKLVRDLAENGYSTVSCQAVEKWLERKTIPTKRLMNLIGLGSDLNHPLNLNECVLGLAYKRRRAATIAEMSQ